MASKMAFGAPTRPPYSQNGLQLALQLAFQGRSGPSKSVVGSLKIKVLAFWAVDVLSDCPFVALRAFLDAFLGSTWSSWRPLGLNLEPLGRLLGSTWSLLGASWTPLGLNISEPKKYQMSTWPPRCAQSALGRISGPTWSLLGRT